MSGKKTKIGLVLEGGGMKCAYGAGILDCFQEAGIEFDYCIGVSAGSGNGMSFLARQHGRNLRFYTEHTSDPRYFGLKPLIEEGGIFGIEFIYNELSKSTGKDPLDYETFAANPCDFEVVATDAETGKAVYFQKSDIQKDDYRVIMCSACLPAVTRPVQGQILFRRRRSRFDPMRQGFRKGLRQDRGHHIEAQGFRQGTREFQDRLYKGAQGLARDDKGRRQQAPVLPRMPEEDVRL